jgi:hypothetical protein
VYLAAPGVRQFFSDKYELQAPPYMYLSDYDKKNTFASKSTESAARHVNRGSL